MNKFCHIPAVLYILHKLVLGKFQNFEKNIYQKQKKILQNDYNIVTIIKCRQLKNNTYKENKKWEDTKSILKTQR